MMLESDRLFQRFREMGVTHFAPFLGERAREVGVEGVAREINRALDQLEAGDYDVVG